MHYRTRHRITRQHHLTALNLSSQVHIASNPVSRVTLELTRPEGGISLSNIFRILADSILTVNLHLQVEFYRHLPFVYPLPYMKGYLLPAALPQLFTLLYASSSVLRRASSTCSCSASWLLVLLF